MFQSPDDLLTITGSVVTSFGEKVRRSRLGFKQDGANRKKSMFSLAVLMQCFHRMLTG